MKKVFAFFIFILMVVCFELKAQTTTEPQPSVESGVAAPTAPAHAKCCHGGNMKGCCAYKSSSDAQSKKSKKRTKGEAQCCASAKGSGKCCAQSSGEHSQKPCHPGCAMPCCAVKKE